ncbi:probable glutathione S-transferase [Solanum tuberosum]|uniref:glutathione transferase n=2 Tax=Solanum tuberosum TaxID=4113 RepID=M0ZQ35_SOLTU|nr:PREDICTED: probable glutathione S-transferase [Solanum tuberosum]
MAQVKLLGFWYSPFTHRVEWALKIKGVKYEYTEIEQDKKNLPRLEDYPSYKQVPVLIDNDRSICGSMVILEYIAEKFGRTSILPDDFCDRALARFWANFLHNKMETVRNAFLGKGKVQEKSIVEVCEMLKILGDKLEGKTFFVANEFGFADIVANMVGFWLGVYQEVSGVELVTEKKFPIFCVWRDKYVNCSQVKKYLPSRDKLIAFYQASARPQAAASASTQALSIVTGP